jgi:hypothetical protein
MKWFKTQADKQKHQTPSDKDVPHLTIQPHK